MLFALACRCACLGSARDLICREAANKHTPLTVAAYNGRHEVIEALYRRNANINFQCGRNAVLLLLPC